jgi:SAM-dependent methyltransferase
LVAPAALSKLTTEGLSHPREKVMPSPQELSCRCRTPEVMDQPGLDVTRHHAALTGLARLNAVSGSAGILWPPLAALAAEDAGRMLRVLDVASGGGDVTLGLWRKARRAGVALHIDGCDISPTAIAFAAQRTRRAEADVQFFPVDVLHDPLPDGYDAIVCSLFLHHLADDEAIELLRRMARAARQLVLVNDLARSRFGLFLAHAAGQLLTRSDVVHTDGPLSVRAAFTLTEAADLARRAELDCATVVSRWPCRFLLSWRRLAHHSLRASPP